MGKNGGKRIGAGRKKASHTIAAEEAKKVLIAAVVKEMKPLVEALLAKAKGGDVHALKEVFDRTWGKSVQQIIPTDPEGNAIPILSVNVVPIEG